MLIDLLKNVKMTITNNETLRQFLESKVVVMSGSHRFQLLLLMFGSNRLVGSELLQSPHWLFYYT